MELRDILLEKKRSPTQEISVYLFEHCNLRCAFCWQDHEDRTGIDSVRSKLAVIEKYFAEEPRSAVSLSIMGGEVFDDKIFDHQMLEDFKFLQQGIVELGVKYNKTVSAHWVSNLVTTKFDMIRELLAHGRGLGLKVDVYTSYDFRGRFNLNQFLAFKVGVEEMWDDISGVSLTLTKNNCRYFVNKVDPYFDYLYNKGAYFYFDFYMPDQDANHQCPTDADLYSVFQKCITQYPKIDPVKSWIENEYNQASCRTSRMVNSNNTRSTCGGFFEAVPQEQVIQIYKVELNSKSNAGIENHFLEKYNCISCEFLDRCSFGCFMQHAGQKFTEELDECVYKKTFKFIDQQ